VSRTAYHEAGHCLAALALGYRVRTVSVSPYGGGLCELDDGFSGDPTPAEIEDALVIAIAGDLAEEHAP
jgi:hypothetical protein